MKKGKRQDNTTDSFDVILLIIVKEADQPLFIKHYTFKDKKAAMHIITRRSFKGMAIIRLRIEKFLNGFIMLKSCLIGMNILRI